MADSLGLAYLSTGALLREQVENSTELGKKAAPILDRGEYLPDDLMCPILADWLERQAGGWVLDGFPRSLPQAHFLEQWLTTQGQHLDAAVSLEVPFDVLLSRMRSRVECPDCRWSGQRSDLVAGDRCPECGTPAGRRKDDDEVNFRSRYREFEVLAQPVIEYYAASDLLHPCDATPPQDETAARLLAALSPSPTSY